MKRVLTFCVLVLLIKGCSFQKNKFVLYESESLKIIQVKENIYQHVSYLDTKNFGKVGCNGMVYINGDEAIVFDTPIDNGTSGELINWIGSKKIKAVVVTHFHIDCLGGLETFHAHDIQSFASNQTIGLAKAQNEKVLPQYGFGKHQNFKVGGEDVFAKYFGEGHTEDNIIGYVPSEKTLFGGCLIKSLDAPKGNLSDANTSLWSSTVEYLKNEIPALEVVVPGHGHSGGVELLDYTIGLFKDYDQRYLFFLHNRFLETHDLYDEHPEFGRTEYNEIVGMFKKEGFHVLSEKRNGNVNAREYAVGVVDQIESLISKGIDPNRITVVGTSKGGYIAQYVSTLANNPELNFVFIGSYRDSDLEVIPEINFCGNILNIYERTDPFGVSAIKRKESSSCTILHFKELELNTGMGHGFLFKPMKEWIGPTIKWGNQEYGD